MPPILAPKKDTLYLFTAKSTFIPDATPGTGDGFACNDFIRAGSRTV